MIPKIIHYCWFGRNPLPPLAVKCIESWKKYLPDYEIKEWNEDNFDVNIIPYTSEAYSVKKYAFVSDYARFWLLYKYGGVYFDTDVEVIRPIDDIVERGAFMGCEKDDVKYRPLTVAPGLGIGAEPGMSIYKEIIDYYNCSHFLNPDGIPDLSITVVGHLTSILKKNGLQELKGIQKVCGVTIYPSEYFAPINFTTHRIHITKNTRTIHHYMASWTDNSKKTWKSRLYSIMPEWILIANNRLKWIMRKYVSRLFYKTRLGLLIGKF